MFSGIWYLGHVVITLCETADCLPKWLYHLIIPSTMCEVDPVFTMMIVEKDRVLTLQWPILSFRHRVLLM